MVLPPSPPADGTAAPPHPSSEGPPRWDLSPIFAGLDDRAFVAALEGIGAGIDRLVALYDHHDIRATAPRPPTPAEVDALEEVLEATNRLSADLRPVTAYLYALVSTDSRDERAAALTAELQARTAPLGPLGKRLDAWVAARGPAALAAASELAAAHAFALETGARNAVHQMSEDEESLAAQLATTGSLAWQRLHGDLTSQLQVELRHADGTVERLPMSLARGLATDPDPVRRRAAYEAELAAWETVAVPLAAALNGAKGELAVVNRRRGFADDLEPALRANNVDRASVEAMHRAVDASLPEFRRYLRTKALVLGHEGGLPWWELFAPLPGAAPLTWSEATASVRDAFGAYSFRLDGLAARAFAERWVDAEMRDGKRSGAYCVGVGGGISRIMMNFDHSADAVSTLAHELGHAYHNLALADRTPIQRRLPMALAETASIFCETLLFSRLLAGATSPVERLALLDLQLVGAAQVVVDIRSRFRFETELCARRRRTTLSVRELCELMAEAQETTYGEGLHPEHRHRYMWAVKGHYFTPFYNWPYTFGLLFGLGLFSRYQADPDRFRAGYDDLLASTGMADAATLGRRFGIDVAEEGFWTSSLDVLRGHIADFASTSVEVAAMAAAGPAATEVNPGGVRADR